VELAGLLPDDIDYINSIGTGTKMNGRGGSEGGAINFWAPVRRWFPCSSFPQPVTGHCIGATSSLEAIFPIAAMATSNRAAHSHSYPADPQCAIQPQPLKAAPTAIRHVMSQRARFLGLFTRRGVFAGGGVRRSGEDKEDRNWKMASNGCVMAFILQLQVLRVRWKVWVIALPPLFSLQG